MPRRHPFRTYAVLLCLMVSAQAVGGAASPATASSPPAPSAPSERHNPTLERLIARDEAVLENSVTRDASGAVTRLVISMQCPVADADIAALRDLPKLRQLHLPLRDKSTATDAGLEQLANLQALKRLSLNCGVLPGPAALDAAGRIAGLEDLSLDYVQIGPGRRPIADADLDRIANLATLKRLSLCFANLTGPGIARLERAERLKELNLFGLRQLRPGDLRSLARLPELRLLRIAGDLDDAAVAELAESRGLRELLIQGDDVTPTGIAALQRAPALRWVNVSGAKIRWKKGETLKSFHDARPDVKVEIN